MICNMRNSCFVTVQLLGLYDCRRSQIFLSSSKDKQFFVFISTSLFLLSRASCQTQQHLTTTVSMVWFPRQLVVVNKSETAVLWHVLMALLIEVKAVLWKKKTLWVLLKSPVHLSSWWSYRTHQHYDPVLSLYI